jgi:hypothetical protein
MLLLEIRGKTISFASYIKKIKEQRFNKPLPLLKGLNTRLKIIIE